MAIETKVELRDVGGPFRPLVSIAMSLVLLSPITPFGHFRATATDTDSGESAPGFGQSAKEAEVDAINRLRKQLQDSTG